MADKYPSTLLAQSNDPQEIQKADLDLLKKINGLSSESATETQIDDLQDQIDTNTDNITTNTDNIATMDVSRLLSYQKDSTTRSFGTGTATGWTTSPFTVPASQKIKVEFSIPARNDSSSWGGGYAYVYYRKDGGAWNYIGSSGFDMNVMYNSATSIATYTNDFILDFTGSTSDTQVEIQFRHKTYDGTMTINGSHDIANGDVTSEWDGTGFAWSHIIVTNVSGMGPKGDTGTSATTNNLGIFQAQHQVLPGVSSGAIVAGAWRTGPLNTIVYNDIEGASLSSNQFTLPAGKYKLNAWRACFYVNGYATRIYNVTDATTAIIGSNGYADQGEGYNSEYVPIQGILDIYKTTSFEVQLYPQTGYSTGWGFSTNSYGGLNRNWSDVLVERIEKR